MKRFYFTILYTLFLISLIGCQTVSKKIEDTTTKEEQELSKWLNKPEEDLKSFYGQPDKVEFLKTRNRNYVYITEKYKIKCERKFEVNQGMLWLVLVAKIAFNYLRSKYSASKVNLFNFNKSFFLNFRDNFFTRNSQ